MKHPTREEYKTPDHVRRHCRAVAHVAYAIGEALVRHGIKLDLELILAAGLLHDIARVEDNHWDVGADLMEKLGYEGESRIIREHMFYSPFSSIENVTETDMVCLGDRLVKEDRYVGLDDRIQYIIEKAKSKGHGDAVPFIMKKKRDTLRFMEEIQGVIGISIDALMGQTGGEWTKEGRGSKRDDPQGI